ncbi:MAG: hypothetical protein JNJ70_21005 [Verrucomicrobiales bacterium]|nr:hypothetical protein [Verrucomicrobiales bacterium]
MSKNSNYSYDGPFSFAELPGIRYTNERVELHWLVTGCEKIDFRYMSTGDGRRDLARCQSGRHLGSLLEVCAAELRIDLKNPPPGSHHIQFTGYPDLVDLRAAGDQAFSGVYYDDDKTASYQFMASSKDLFSTGHFQGLMRRSVPMVREGNSGDVVALLPSSMENLGIAWIQPLGDSPHIPVILPDGRIRSTSDFPPP